MTSLLVVGLVRGAAWAREAAKARDIQLAGIVDLDEEKLGRVGDELGVPHANRFASFEAALAAPADVVVLAVPTPLHKPLSLAALEAGRHVICEKPLAASLEEGRELRDAVATYDRRYMIGEQYRFADGVENLRRAVQSGLIGRVGYIEHQFLRMHTPSRAAHWAHDLDSAIPEMSVHHFDMWWYATGQRIVEIRADPFNPSWNPPGRRFGYSMRATLEDGTHVHYLACRAESRPQTSWHGVITIVGDEGALTWDGNGPAVTYSRRLPSPDPRQQQLAVGPVSYVNNGTVGNATMNLMVRELVDAIREGRPHQCDVADNWPSFATAMAALESVRGGGVPVKVAAS
ncbi:MAG TPA: Gfo/Idh/MocA family oxidoreductase [Chloroflexota bacterium]|nr:Gfo/Idh/MocA family oxidoreductase [Chloroflexota bacterium]